MQAMNFYRKIRHFAWKASMLGLPRGAHITRYYMYARLQELSYRISPHTGRVLSVSHSDNLLSLLRIKPTELVHANYPEHNFTDLQFSDGSFDFVVSDQVLEHVEGNPQQAIDETYRLLRHGGLSIQTTCFINPLHGVPKDFWRFTPDALALLHKNFSQVIEVGGWGNFDVWSVVRDGMRFFGVPHATWHPLHKLAMKNEESWPIVTWIIARK